MVTQERFPRAFEPFPPQVYVSRDCPNIFESLSLSCAHKNTSVPLKAGRNLFISMRSDIRFLGGKFASLGDWRDTKWRKVVVLRFVTLFVRRIKKMKKIEHLTSLKIIDATLWIRVPKNLQPMSRKRVSKISRTSSKNINFVFRPRHRLRTSIYHSHVRSELCQEKRFS